MRCLDASYQSPKDSLAFFTVSLPWQPQAISLCSPKEGLGQDNKGFWLIPDGWPCGHSRCLITNPPEPLPAAPRRDLPAGDPAPGHVGVSNVSASEHYLSVMCDEGFAAVLGACWLWALGVAWALMAQVLKETPFPQIIKLPLFCWLSLWSLATYMLFVYSLFLSSPEPCDIAACHMKCKHNNAAVHGN